MFRNFRKWHRWISVVIAIPFTLTVVTGIILSTRAFNTWVQPDYPAMNSKMDPSFDKILAAAQNIPEAEIKTWNDVSQIDIRPAKGNIRVRSKNMWEVQIDSMTGQVVGSGIRRFSFLVQLHEGAYFGDLVRYGIFFPSALGVFFLLISGIIIYISPYLKKSKNLETRTKS